MLGLGSSLTTGGVSSLPPISTMGTHSLYRILPDRADDGPIDITQATTTNFDLRIFASSTDFVSPVTDYTVTSITFENTTTSSGAVELVTSPLTLDSTANFGGVLLFSFDNDSVMDDLDFGSSSSYAFKHNGSGSTNLFNVVLKFTHAQFDGVKTIQFVGTPLTDSDA
jgi:hypothetical protein